MSFAEYVTLLQRRWRIWVGMVLVGLLAAGGYNVLADKRYTAVATSFVTVTETGTAGPSGIFQGSQFAVQRMSSYSALSSSPQVLDPVIDKFALDVPLRRMREMVDVSSPADSVLLEVSVMDSEPQRAAALADETSRQLGVLIEQLETPRGRAASLVRVTLTQPADVPVAVSSPRIWLNLLLGLVGGAAAGLVLALLRHHLDRRLKTAEDVRAIAKVAPLGSTLYSRSAKRQPLVALDHRSAAAERYRSIRTALRLADVDRELRHLVVSSPMAGDGKTSVASNLAVSWAQIGVRVCLVDAGLRRPMVPQFFGLDGTAGLSDVLVGDVELDDVLTPWNGGELTILPAGSLPPDPAALLDSSAMKHLVAELRGRFDIVIYDSEPMVAVNDAAVLARQVDGLVLVVRAGSTTRDQLATCLDLVGEARLTLLGTVQSGVRLDRRARSSYYAPDGGWGRPELSERSDATTRATTDRSGAVAVDESAPTS
ncbi:hypothetical protein GCM10009616_01220 [Microlunatus lacustris]